MIPNFLNRYREIGFEVSGNNDIETEKLSDVELAYKEKLQRISPEPKTRGSSASEAQFVKLECAVLALYPRSKFAETLLGWEKVVTASATCANVSFNPLTTTEYKSLRDLLGGTTEEKGKQYEQTQFFYQGNKVKALVAIDTAINKMVRFSYF